MTQKDIETYLDGAGAVAKRLIERAGEDERGLFWETISMGAEMKRTEVVSEGLYNGNAGVALFLAELYRHTGDQRYLDAVQSSLSWLRAYCVENPPVSMAYFTGRLGVFEPFLLMAKLTGEARYREWGLEAVASAKEPFEELLRVDDLLNGKAGAMLGLAKLHAASGADWALDSLDRMVEGVILGANMGAKGLYWDRSEQNITGLCGFSHGSAGVGCALFETAAYLDNPALRWLAEQAFAYERYWFNPEVGAWPDLRKGVFKDSDREEHLEALHSGDLKFFHEPRYMDAWCHGAHGIGLSRIRAYELTGAYRDDVDRALARAEQTLRPFIDTIPDKGDFTLCHGLCGSVDVFLEAHRCLDLPLSDLVDAAAQRVLSILRRGETFSSGYGVFKPNPEDNSLFMGSAGIGYFLLRMNDLASTPSVLLPRAAGGPVSPERGAWLNVSLADARKTLLRKYYWRALTILEKVAADELRRFLESEAAAENILDAFETFAAGDFPALSDSARACLGDAFRFERERMAMLKAVSSDALLFAKQLDHQEKLETLGLPSANRALRFQLPEESRMIETRWNWVDAENPADRLSTDEQPTMALLRPMPTGVQEFDLGVFAHVTLTAFSKPTDVNQAVATVGESFELEDEAQRAQVEAMTLQQIDEAVNTHMLAYAN